MTGCKIEELQDSNNTLLKTHVVETHVDDEQKKR